MSALLTLLSACTRSSGPVEPAAPPADPPEEAPEETPEEATTPVGGWSSMSCGERDYERRITLSDGGAFSGEERLSPCPPDVACVWSGVHRFSGQWTLSELTITLSVSQTDAQGDIAAGWPTALTWSEGRLLEGECAYAPWVAPKPPR
jgi:hypothetical protein